MGVEIINADALAGLRGLRDESCHVAITSPPYFGLRQYLPPDSPLKELELGAEETPQEYVAKMVEVFREVRRVLRSDGSLWLNLGDSFANDEKWGGETGGKQAYLDDSNRKRVGREKRKTGLRPKNLIGIPWRVAFALQADGWHLRQWMPWVKKSSMPESTKDRPCCACEAVFLLSKSEHYFYNYKAVKLPGSMALAQQVANGYNGHATKDFASANAQDASAVKNRIIAGKRRDESHGGWRATRNSDWMFEGLLNDECGDPLAFMVNTAGFRGAHFATFPPALVRPCILAGTSARGCCPQCGAIWLPDGDRDRIGRPDCQCFVIEDTPNPVPCNVLDPFAGSGTVGRVALELGCDATLIELNPEYIPMIRERCDIAPGLPIGW